MPSQSERATTFSSLHVKGRPLILFNIWDAGSAQVVSRAGAKAIATGSWSVAAAHGYADGEKLPLELALANLQRIVGAVDLPVTLDFEAGYARTPAALAMSAARVLESGAIGFNLEDQIIGEGTLFSVTEQAARIRAARSAADRVAIPAFINARTDIFLKADSATHGPAMLDSALVRAEAYLDAGASGFFAPGLIDEALIAALCDRCALPVNILAMPNAPPTAQLAAAGVARISHGPWPYRSLMRVLEDAATKVISADQR